MKNLFLYIFILIIVSSCELTDVLENDPPNNLIPENVVQNEDDAAALLNGVYSSLIPRSAPNYYYMEIETLPSALIGSMGQSGFGDNHLQFGENDLFFDNGIVNLFWGTFYNVINQANNSIALTNALADSEFSGANKTEILGEGHFMRAMATFDALRYFGQFYDPNSPLGVVVRDEPSNFVTRNQPRSTVNQCYEQIYTDLDFAIANAPDFTVTYRASKTAAKALKARVLLFEGRYADAASLADEVITEGIRALESDFASVFSTGFSSSEMILMTYRDENSDVDQANRKRFYTGRAAGTGWFADLMAVDPRLPFTYTSTTSGTGLKVNNLANYRPTYYLRLAEMYLIKAEGLAFSGASLADSKAPLDTIRNRAGIGISTATTMEELKDDIFEEIVRELAFENGSEWFAAIRFDKAMTLKPSITSTNQYILPIPEAEINGNSLISFADQNPGYE